MLARLDRFRCHVDTGAENEGLSRDMTQCLLEILFSTSSFEICQTHFCYSKEIE